MQNSLGISQDDLRSFYLKSLFEDDEEAPVDVEREWWYLDEPRDPDAELCHSCQHIDFQYMLRNRIEMYRGPTLLLQDMLVASQSCAFCRLAIHAFRYAEGGALPQSEKDGKHVICQITTMARSTAALNSSHYLVLYRRKIWERQVFEKLAFLHVLTPHGELYSGRTVSPAKADILLLKSWLQTCERLHVETGNSPQSPSLTCAPQLRLIDTVLDCIVEVDVVPRYIALSYVWGQICQLELNTSNSVELMKPGSLRAARNRGKIPKTIRDAFNLVPLLNERYLWVDALCIIQDGRDKAAQIENMDQIYCSAILTVAACAGQDANAGLPRIGDAYVFDPDIQQCNASVQGVTLANILSDMSVTVDKSIWNDRAWTYQERALSKRLLYITETQAYFECDHGGTFVEDSILEENSLLRSSDPLFVTTEIRGAQMSTNIEIFADAVERYSSRKLTKVEDGLMAMAGILSSLKPRFRSEFLFGLPASELDIALLWQPLGDVKRRKSHSGQLLFPSWSWAGWVGTVKYWLGVQTLSLVTWIDALTGDGFTSHEYRQPIDPNVASDWVLSDLKWVEDEAYHEVSQPDIHFRHPVAREEDRKRREYLPAGTHILHFRAFTCTFFISEEHASPGTGITSCQSVIDPTNVMHQLCALKITNKEGLVVGAVHIPSSISQALVQKEHEFILLSRTRLFCDETPEYQIVSETIDFSSYTEPRPGQKPRFESDDDAGPMDHVEFNTEAFDGTKPWCVCNVMLVESQQGSSQRLGLGKVHLDAVLQAKPVWKEFQLK